MSMIYCHECGRHIDIDYVDQCVVSREDCKEFPVEQDADEPDQEKA